MYGFLNNIHDFMSFYLSCVEPRFEGCQYHFSYIFSLFYGRCHPCLKIFSCWFIGFNFVNGTQVKIGEEFAYWKYEKYTKFLNFLKSRKTRMTTFIKAKVKKWDGQANIDKYRRLQDIISEQKFSLFDHSSFVLLLVVLRITIWIKKIKNCML